MRTSVQIAWAKIAPSESRAISSLFWCRKGVRDRREVCACTACRSAYREASRPSYANTPLLSTLVFEVQDSLCRELDKCANLLRLSLEDFPAQGEPPRSLHVGIGSQARTTLFATS
jgi:hypothetical protein